MAMAPSLSLDTIRGFVGSSDRRRHHLALPRGGEEDNHRLSCCITLVIDGTFPIPPPRCDIEEAAAKDSGLPLVPFVQDVLVVGLNG